MSFWHSTSSTWMHMSIPINFHVYSTILWALKWNFMFFEKHVELIDSLSYSELSLNIVKCYSWMGHNLMPIFPFYLNFLAHHLIYKSGKWIILLSIFSNHLCLLCTLWLNNCFRLCISQASMRIIEKLRIYTWIIIIQSLQQFKNESIYYLKF